MYRLAFVIPQAVFVAIASLGDAIVGAIIAGIFLLVNTALTVWLAHHLTKSPAPPVPTTPPEPVPVPEEAHE